MTWIEEHFAKEYPEIKTNDLWTSEYTAPRSQIWTIWKRRYMTAFQTLTAFGGTITKL